MDILALIVALVALVVSFRPRAAQTGGLSTSTPEDFPRGRRKPVVRDDEAGWRVENKAVGEPDTDS